MKNAKALTVGAIITIFAVLSILIIVTRKKQPEKTVTVTTIEQVKHPPYEFRACQNEKHSQVEQNRAIPIEQSAKVPKGVSGKTLYRPHAKSGAPGTRATHEAVLRIISAQLIKKSNASLDTSFREFEKDIEAILAGVGGLKSGDDCGKLKNKKRITNTGTTGSRGIDDLIGSHSVTISALEFVKGDALTGRRSYDGIKSVVILNLEALRHTYNNRLRVKPDLNEKITCKIFINESGTVRSCQVIDPKNVDIQLEAAIARVVRLWIFDKIDNPGDVTEVAISFIFNK
ncbi:MAG: AgmX/PglI C-terminal domain-containing protein [Chitinispirillaceae bacterium]|nr:AgmX/PglI C-terminal domain-containing protein [Chitinispirillaceae bacterium]